ncbi:MAG TPA: deoxyhypusine synthase [Ignavibacteria bacterium]|nr:deoxyhypusine synthase [Ignavibacteria bacterium]
MPHRVHSTIKKKYESGIADIGSFKKPKLKNRSNYLKSSKIDQKNLSKNTTIEQLIEQYFQAYNAARLSEACRVFVQNMLDDDVTIGMSLTGALTPAGLGSSMKPLIEFGFVDWIVSTGANMYHDTHFALGHTLHKGSPFLDDVRLRDEWVIRIYDVLFDADVLYSTDAFYRKLIMLPEFQKKMSTREFYYLTGKYLYNIEKNMGMKEHSVLATAYKCGVPVYTSSPGDSSIGMNVAAVELEGSRLEFDVNKDVNETAAIVLNAKKRGAKGKAGRSGVLIFGGGSPKNFMLQTEPQIQEVLGIQEKGHDFFLQFTDARPDTGGLSGATPSEAVSWGKVDPDKLPGTIVCYLDTTVAMPLFTAYALKKHKPRKLKRLAEKADELFDFLMKEYKKANK